MTPSDASAPRRRLSRSSRSPRWISAAAAASASAEEAELTERTFFRHFADKREVLFAGSAQLQDLLVETVAGAPASVTPIDAVAAGIEAIGTMLQESRGRAFARQRQSIVAASAELRERELNKMSSLP